MIFRVPSNPSHSRTGWANPEPQAGGGRRQRGPVCSWAGPPRGAMAAGRELQLPSSPAGSAVGTNSPLIGCAFRRSHQSDEHLTRDALHACEAGWWRPGSDGAGPGRGERRGEGSSGARAGMLLGAAVSPSDPGGMGPCVALSFPRRLRVMLPLVGSPGDCEVSASFTHLLWKSNNRFVLTSYELL